MLFGLVCVGAGLFLQPRLHATSRRTKVDSDLRAIYNAAAAFESQYARWPASIGEMVNAIDPATGTRVPGSLRERPLDPWGREYGYVLTPDPVVFCLGKDGVPGGSGHDADKVYPGLPDSREWDGGPPTGAKTDRWTFFLLVSALVASIVFVSWFLTRRPPRSPDHPITPSGSSAPEASRRPHPPPA